MIILRLRWIKQKWCRYWIIIYIHAPWETQRTAKWECRRKMLWKNSMHGCWHFTLQENVKILENFSHSLWFIFYAMSHVSLDLFSTKRKSQPRRYRVDIEEITWQFPGQWGHWLVTDVQSWKQLRWRQQVCLTYGPQLCGLLIQWTGQLGRQARWQLYTMEQLQSHSLCSFRPPLSLTSTDSRICVFHSNWHWHRKKIKNKLKSWIKWLRKHGFSMDKKRKNIKRIFYPYF